MAKKKEEVNGMHRPQQAVLCESRYHAKSQNDKPFKPYSTYSPVEHPHGTVHKTFEEAEHNH